MFIYKFKDKFKKHFLLFFKDKMSNKVHELVPKGLQTTSTYK